MAKKNASNRYIAFLRGINVGGHRVKMDELRDHFAALKFANVSTFIASGNVIFDATSPDPAELERRIEAHLERALGYEAATFVRTPADLATILETRPFPSEEVETPGFTVHVGFLRQALAAEDAARLRSFRTAMDEFHVAGRELYWLCRGKTTDSLVSWPKVTKLVPMASTMRNMTMLRKLAAMLGS